MFSGLGFWGEIGGSPGLRQATSRNAEWTTVWQTKDSTHSMFMTATPAAASWQNLTEGQGLPVVFVFGTPMLASDCRFGPDTSVRRLAADEGPQRISELYRLHGIRCLAGLDGHFALVIYDPGRCRLTLVADRFGSSDIFFRVEPGRILFASHPGDLADRPLCLDATTLTFFLAQEGFFPAPYTFSRNIQSIGRSHALHLSIDLGQLRVQRERYCELERSWQITSRHESIKEFSDLLDQSIGDRMQDRTGVLLSGGVDSSLLFDRVVARHPRELVAVTGAIKGFADGEQAIDKSRRLAAAAGVTHLTVELDPADESIPEDWVHTANSWMNGTRITFPLWIRLGGLLRNRLGQGYVALSGQMADTLADNNYTSATMGYWLRRTLYSSWFSRIRPFLAQVVPPADSSVARLMIALARSGLGDRAACILASIWDGMADSKRFYGGRVFGYAEFPGYSPARFPMLKPAGFAAMSEWYGSNFLDPVLQELDHDNFYIRMMELSMDMVMLHLDTRVVFQALRLSGGRAELPLLDARTVNFFASLPYNARAFYRRPKDILRSQATMSLPSSPTPSHRQVSAGKAAEGPGVEELMLQGSLGSYFRKLLRDASFPSHAPGIFALVDQDYVDWQITAFCNGGQNVNYGLVSRLGALEQWIKSLNRAKPLQDGPGAAAV